MHITFLGHAQLWIRIGEKHILLDPWFAEPVFGQAWWRYPPPPVPTAGDLPAPIDLLLLSHIHPDHSGPGTLAQMSRGFWEMLLNFDDTSLSARVAQEIQV
jgi:L-ascorbate metabolism protein UlaG (beta-lactamase superfamily)